MLLSIGPAVGPARAQPGASPPDATAKAREHFTKAEIHYRQGEFREALAEYKKAQGYKRHPELLFNIAQCHRQLGELKKAIFYYKLFLSESPGASNKAAIEAIIQKMQARVNELERIELEKGKISIVTRPAGALIYVDDFTGKPVAKSPATLRLGPGSHLVAIRLEGYEEVHRKLDVQKGQVSLLKITLEKPDEKRPGTARPIQPPRPPPTAVTYESPFYRRWWFWTGAGLAVAAVATAAYTGATTLKMQDDWDAHRGPPPGETDFEERFNAYRTATDVLLFGGLAIGVATVIGAAIVGKGRKVEKPAAPTASSSPWSNTLVAPSCGPTGCGLHVTGRF